MIKTIPPRVNRSPQSWSNRSVWNWGMPENCYFSGGKDHLRWNFGAAMGTVFSNKPKPWWKDLFLILVFLFFLRLPFSFFFCPANFWTWRLGMFGTTGPAMWGFGAWGRGTLWVESLGDARYIQWLGIYTVIASPYNIKYPTKSRWNHVKCIGSILFFGPII